LAGALPAGTPKGFDYGEGGLAVVLWPGGRLVAGRLPDGSSMADVKPDGSLVAKLGWWRAAAGKLVIAGERLDAEAPALSADVPDGYGSTGFQATAVTFPTTGCWKVVGAVVDAPDVRGPHHRSSRLNAATISRSNSITCSCISARARSASRSRIASSSRAWSTTAAPNPGTRSSTTYQTRSDSRK
jgi:hypothetical protein